MYGRFGIATVTGAAITAGLLFTMQALIASGQSALTDARDYKFLDFVRAQRQELVERKQPKPDKPQQPDQPPPDAPQMENDVVNPEVGVIGVPPVDVSTDVNTGGFGLAVSDGDYLPIFKVAPAYPNQALARGLEGFVLVEFTVTTNGSVRDAFVVESSSPLFEKAAVAAALKFKYKPRVVDGVAIEVAGVQNKISFQLERQR